MKRSRSSDEGTESKRAKAASSPDTDGGALSTARAGAQDGVRGPHDAATDGANDTPVPRSGAGKAEEPEQPKGLKDPKEATKPEELDVSSEANEAAEPVEASGRNAAEAGSTDQSNSVNDTSKANEASTVTESQPGQPEGAGKDSKGDSKGESKDDPEMDPSKEPEAKPEEKPEAKSEKKSDAQPDVKPEKTDATSDARPDAKPDAAPDAAADTKSDAKPVGFASFSSTKPTGFSSFSSGFGGFSSSSKFGSIAKTPKANPWAEKPPADEEKGSPANDDAAADKDGSRESSVENDAYAQVKLEKQELKTGEENEETLFQMRVRLYAMDLSDTDGKAWKERGTGLLKLNKAATANKHRLLMRADGVLRVSLNLPLVQHMQVTKGFATSLHSEKFVKLAGIESGKPHQFAVRCGTEDQRDELYDAIINARP